MTGRSACAVAAVRSMLDVEATAEPSARHTRVSGAPSSRRFIERGREGSSRLIPEPRCLSYTQSFVGLWLFCCEPIHPSEIGTGTEIGMTRACVFRAWECRISLGQTSAHELSGEGPVSFPGYGTEQRHTPNRTPTRGLCAQVNRSACANRVGPGRAEWQWRSRQRAH